MTFDGAGDYLSVPDSSDWDFGTGDFTISLWVYFDSVPDHGDAIISTLGGVTGYMMSIQSGTIYCYSTGTGWVSTGVPAVTGQWMHLAVVRDGDTLHIYIDGSEATTSDCTGISIDSDSDLVIGRKFASVDGKYFSGYLDEIKISRWVATWTGNFTPPDYPGP